VFVLTHCLADFIERYGNVVGCWNVKGRGRRKSVVANVLRRRFALMGQRCRSPGAHFRRRSSTACPACSFSGVVFTSSGMFGSLFAMRFASFIKNGNKKGPDF
jgi:hypothetical protein